MNLRSLMSKTQVLSIAAVILLAVYGFTSRSTAGDQQGKAKVGTAIGDRAPELAFLNPDSTKVLKLSELRGKYVLIDFWASWCRPCRIENPNVKRVYERFRSKGFEILGVSLDRDHESWVKAIKDDGLPWKHVSDLQFWSNAAAQEYGVTGIPYTVLVDREGRILEKGLRAHDLEGKLAQLLGK